MTEMIQIYNKTSREKKKKRREDARESSTLQSRQKTSGRAITRNDCQLFNLTETRGESENMNENIGREDHRHSTSNTI